MKTNDTLLNDVKARVGNDLVGVEIYRTDKNMITVVKCTILVKKIKFQTKVIPRSV